MAYTDLTAMRNDFLAKTQAKLLAKDFSTAAETDLILSGALVRAFDSINNFDPISSSALSMIANVGSLNTYLADPSNRDAFEQILADSKAMTAITASSTAMTAITASSTAMTAVLANSTALAAVLESSTAMSAITASSTAMTAITARSTAMTAVLANSTALAAVLESSTAMSAIWASNVAADAVLTSSTARLAVYNSDTALTALQANPTQVQRQLDIPDRTVSAVTGSSSFTFVNNGTKVILLRRYYSSSEYDYIVWGKDKTSDNSAGGLTSPTGRNLFTSEQAVGCNSGTYNSNGIMPTTNDVTGNFVAAANGLRRSSWAYGNYLFVRYIIV